VMHVGDQRPAIRDQGPRDVRADALSSSGDDGCPSVAHVPSLLRLHRNDNRMPMPESRPPIELQGLTLSALQDLADQRRLPPVDKWNPDRCGHSGMRIARDGTWYHQGSPIRRPAMTRLFSTVLRREPDGSHVLVTPVEKLEIEVDSTAFRAIEMRSEGEGTARRIALKLDSGDVVILGPDHPLAIVETEAGPSPRLLVRHGLEAELTRSVYYELADIALAEGHEPAGIWSNGAFFALDSAE